MKYEYIKCGGTTFKRIDKKRAKFIYNWGYVRMVPICEASKGWICLVRDVKKRMVDRYYSDLETDAQNYLNWFRWKIENVTKKESEILFYIPVKLIDAFTGKEPTEYTINTLESYDDEFFKTDKKDIDYESTEY